MYRIRYLHLLWFIPISWIDAFVVRRKSFETRYAHMRMWSHTFISIFKMKQEIEQAGEFPNDAPVLFVSNHQSAFDLLMLMNGISLPFTFISKVENAKVPYISNWSKTLELIFFDREDRSSAIHMLREAARRLKMNKNLLIFPEGTRAKGRVMHEMQAGSLQPAFMAKAYVIPVVLLNSFTYKDMIKKKGTCRMKILKPIPYEEYKSLKKEGLIKELQRQMQRELDKEQEFI